MDLFVTVLAAVGTTIGIWIGAMQLLDRRRERKNAMIMKDEVRRSECRQVLNKGGLVDKTLLEYYSPERLDGLQTFSGSIDSQSFAIPVATRKDWVSLQVGIENVDTELERFPEWNSAQTMTCVDSAYIQRLRDAFKNTKAKAWSDSIYRLTRIKISKDRIWASFSVDEFLNYINNSGLMSGEIEEALLDANMNPQRMLNKPGQSLPLRNALLPDGRSIESVGNRMCAGGVSVLMAIARPAPFSDYVFPVIRRSAKVALGRNRLALTPQGLHQPLNAQGDISSLSDTLYRELYEELFRGTEVEHGGHRFKRGWYIERSPTLRWITDNPEKCTQEFVCFNYSLMGGNFEFGAILVIHDPEFWQEFESEMETNWEGKLHSLASSKDPNVLTELLLRDDWVPECRFLAIQGLLRLAELDQERVSLPAIVINLP